MSGAQRVTPAVGGGSGAAHIDFIPGQTSAGTVIMQPGIRGYGNVAPALQGAYAPGTVFPQDAGGGRDDNEGEEHTGIPVKRSRKRYGGGGGGGNGAVAAPASSEDTSSNPPATPQLVSIVSGDSSQASPTLISLGDPFPGEQALLLLVVHQDESGGAGQPTVPALTDGGLTWVTEADSGAFISNPAGSLAYRRITAYAAAKPAHQAIGTSVVYTSTGGTPNIQWALLAVRGFHSTIAVRQATNGKVDAANPQGSPTLTLTMNPFTNASNLGLLFTSEPCNATDAPELDLTNITNNWTLLGLFTFNNISAWSRTGDPPSDQITVGGSAVTRGYGVLAMEVSTAE